MNPPSKILIIRRDNIGDLVCTTPAIAALRKNYPKAEIGALVNSYNAEVLSGNPNLDHIFVYQKLKHVVGWVGRVKAVVERLMLIAKLRRWKPDITILAKASYDYHGHKFSRQIGSKLIIGFLRDGQGKAGDSNYIGISSKGNALTHEVEVLSKLLEPLEICGANGSLQLFPSGKTLEKIGKLLPCANVRIVLQLSAREAERRWGTVNFIELCKYILKTWPECQIVLLWSPGSSDNRTHPGDDEIALSVMQSIESERVVGLPSQNIRELVAAVSMGDLFIGADGGAMHVAAGVGKPILALFENLPEKLNHWYPWKVPYKIVCSKDPYNPNVSEITQIELQEALHEIMRVVEIQRVS